MTPLVSKLVLAAVLASSVPAAASAADCDHDRRPPATYSDPYRPGPAPSPQWREGSWGRGSWRERELREVRAELRALDQQRAEFHARYAGRPGKLRKFDRWYAERRGELERRWYELQAVAWR